MEQIRNEDLSLILITLGTIFTLIFGVWLFKIRKSKTKTITKVFLGIMFMASIISFSYGVNLKLNLVPQMTRQVYPTLTSSAPKEQIDLNAGLLIAMIPDEAKNCKILDSMHMDIKTKIEETPDDPNTQENLKINNDLFNVVSYNLGIRCSTKKL